jgi:hypothetical protein
VDDGAVGEGFGEGLTMIDKPDGKRWGWQPWRPFVLGVLMAVAVVAGLWTFSVFRTSGGQVESSPDGKFQLRISADINPAAHAPYTIEMIDGVSGDVLRRLVLHLSPAETTRGLREIPRVVRWSHQSNFAEVQFGQKPTLRIYAP